MKTNIAEAYWSATADQRFLIDMILLKNPDEMSPDEQLKLVRMAAAYALVQINDIKVIDITPTEKAVDHELEVQKLRTAMKPFADLVMTTSGPIPYERLSFADWHSMANAYKS